MVIIMERSILETSIVVEVARRQLNKLSYLKKRLSNICEECQIYKKCSALSRIIIISLRYSLFGRISEVRENQVGIVAIDNSEFIRRLSKMLKSHKQNFINAQTSVIVGFAKEIKREFYSFPIRVIGIIGVMAVSANTVLSIVLQNKDFGLLWWLARIALLFLAISGSFCRASWEDVNKTSFFLRRINKSCKIGN